MNDRHSIDLVLRSNQTEGQHDTPPPLIRVSDLSH